jgi:hypothetical protein
MTTPRAIYEASLIEHHQMQCYAAMRVLMWVRANHRADVVERHMSRLLRALRYEQPERERR